MGLMTGACPELVEGRLGAVTLGGTVVGGFRVTGIVVKDLNQSRPGPKLPVFGSSSRGD